MKIFALETDEEKLKKSLLAPNERELLAVHFHGFRFALRVLVHLFFTLILIAVAAGALTLGLPAVWVIPTALVVWFLADFLPLLRAFLDWKFDLLMLTTEKVVIVDQSSLLHQHIQQMNLENVASVSARTQFADLLPFGMVCFALKEGTGRNTCHSYIPDAARVASLISHALTDYMRRDDNRPGAAHPVTRAEN